MSNASFWSYNTPALAGVTAFSSKPKKKRTTKTRVFLLLRLSYSFLILSSFLGGISSQTILTFIPVFGSGARVIRNQRCMSVLRKTVRRNPDIYPGYFLDSWISINPDNFPGRS
jgi:hypothetical protein